MGNFEKSSVAQSGERQENPKNFVLLSQKQRDELYQNLLEKSGELFRQKRHELMDRVWTKIAAPDLNYAFTQTIDRHHSMPLSGAILSALKNHYGDKERNPKEIMYYCLDYLQNAPENRIGMYSSGLGNIDKIYAGESIKIIQEAGRWKLRVFDPKGEVRMEGFLFPPKPALKPVPDKPKPESKATPRIVLTAESKPLPLPDKPKPEAKATPRIVLTAESKPLPLPTPATEAAKPVPKKPKPAPEPVSVPRPAPVAKAPTGTDTVVTKPKLPSEAMKLAPAPEPVKPKLELSAELQNEAGQLAAEIKNILLELDEGSRTLGSTTDAVRAGLKQIKIKLDLLQQKSPNDPDLYLLQRAFNDIKTDVVNNKTPRLDTSLEQLSREMMGEIKRAGILKIPATTPEVIHSPSLKKTFTQLRGLNIQPSYVVESKNPNAKTVVLFMQTHPGQGESLLDDENKAFDLINALSGAPVMKKLKSVDESQKEIEASLIKSIQSGLGTTVYEEAMPYRGMELSTGMINAFKTIVPETSGINEYRTGSLQAKMQLGDKMKLVGYDVGSRNNKNSLKERHYNGEMSTELRVTTQNVYMASNVRELMQKSSEPVSFLTIGALHETTDWNTDNTEVFSEKNLEEVSTEEQDAMIHQLPLSHALAYYGMNVIVVDTSYKK